MDHSTIVKKGLQRVIMKETVEKIIPKEERETLLVFVNYMIFEET